ncbi:CHAT domain-containing protein [Pseudomonas thivervalensis]|uniref:CHAT domain-containing protein n=1 Tax=Pseudomonas thivervalensis TaxID=86265 RepID=UPI003D6C02DF
MALLVVQQMLKLGGHNCTEPLMSVLASCGRQIKMRPIESSGSISEHVLGMVELAKLIDEIRPKKNEIWSFRKNDALIYCPSSYTFLYRADGKLWQQLNRKLNNVRRNFLKNAIIRNRGYGNSVLHIEEDVFNPYEDAILGGLLREKQVELKHFTTVMSLIAVNQCIPAFRLPNAVMLHHSKLRAIGQLINSNNRKRREKLNFQFLDYSKAVKADIGEVLVASALSGREKILAVCDLPIEWISSGQLPLMFSHEISRVPSTPGNVTLDTLLSRTKVIYPYSALCDVLIVRSFDEGDPIKEHLVSRVKRCIDMNRLPGINISIVDIFDRESLVRALNDFSGLMVIFDCHGGHGGEEDAAWLNVGAERLNIWHIYQEARVPPIVVLAACSTHPVEGSHASVANGLLESGVQSVIGTFAPIDSTHAAVFVTRLLERIALYLPVVLKVRPYTWREIVTRLLRMSYVCDVLDSLMGEHKLLTQAQCDSIRLEVGVSIDVEEDEMWFEKFKASICNVIGYDDEQIKNMWDLNFQFVDTMLFVQLGRPENIVISERVPD